MLNAITKSIPRRPILYLMIVLGLSVFGVMSIPSINFRSVTKSNNSTIAIEISAYGYDPYKVEKLLTKPIEDGLSTVNGIREIRSISEQGKAMIFVKLSEANNIERKILSIQDSIEVSSVDFPANVHKPIIHKYDPNKQPYMVISFQAENLKLNELRDIIEKKIKKKIESVDGVSQAIVAGGSLIEIEVGCDPRKLEAYHISIRDIVNRIQDIHRSYTLGKITRGNKDHNTSVKERFKNIDELNNISFYSFRSEKDVKLSNIALIQSKEREDSTTARFNGIERVSIFVYSASEMNSLHISEKTRDILKSELPNNIRFEVTQDEGEYLKDIYISTAVAFFYLLLFSIGVNLRKKTNYYNLIVLWSTWVSTILIFSLIMKILQIDLSYFISLGVFSGILTTIAYQKKITINQRANIFSISLLLAIYLLDFTYRNNLLEFISFFHLTVLFYPYISQILKSNFSGNGNVSINTTFLFRLRQKLVLKYFDTSLKWITKKTDFVDFNIYVYPLALIFLTILGLFQAGKSEIALSSNIDRQELIAFLEFPSGTSFEHTNSISKTIEDKVSKIEAISDVVSKVDPAHSVFFIHLKEGLVADAEFLNKIRSEIGSVEDGYLFFATNEDSKYFQEIEVDIIGNDDRVLEELANRLASRIRLNDEVAEAVLKFKSARDEIRLFPKYLELAGSKVQFSEVGDQLQLAIQGGVAAKITTEEKEIDIRVRYLKDFRSSIDSLKEIRVKNKDGDFLPLESLLSGIEAKVPLKLYHKNKNRIVSISIKLNELGSSARNRIYEFLEKFPLPDDYHWESDQYLEDIPASNTQRYMIYLFPILLYIALFPLGNNISSHISELVFLISTWFFIIFLLGFLFPGPLPLIGFIGIIFGIIQFFNISKLFDKHRFRIISILFIFTLLLLFTGGVYSYVYYLFSLYSFASLGLFEIGKRISNKWENQNEVKLYDFIIKELKRINYYDTVKRVIELIPKRKKA
ncbi:efflux RND transporter permease subunit [Leptospira bourretii]|uniref:efflux RND transporter permease subunit n=1 Tax=Leptospira bourretii TaxID=2484962 RepID=UPI00109158DF|nr:efflux RND transporter permease subunit [Leptospira bourretii]TGL17380.1 efflux RND transporter permease subunit [Leptospira bourretii]